jgi:propionate catabolism operon transcriptional regulator
MRALREQIVRIADSEAAVAIVGESGSGKELAARDLHSHSQRSAHPFIAVNCGAIAESLLESELFGYEEGAFTGSRRGGHAGLFEAAHRGTLFLDEIGEMPLPLQTRLLRVLEEKEIVRVGGTRPIPVDVRIISATHCDLAQRVADGAFRADLFYRLGVLRVRIPPLRERPDDVIPLAEWCLKNALADMGVRPGANLRAELQACTELLQSCLWPGNVRELRNLMQRVALFLSVEPLQALTPGFLLKLAPELAHQSPTSGTVTALANAPEVDVAEVLARFDGNRAEAAAFLGISRTTLWRRIRSAHPK